MRTRPSLIPVLVAILSCGDAGGGATTDTGASTGSASTASGTTEHPTTGGSTAGTSSDAGTSSGSATASTTAPATTEPGTTGDPGSTTEPDPSTTGTSTGTGTGTDTDSGGGSSTGGQGTVEYAAFYVPGGLDRIVVRKADFDADLCTSVVFVWPMQNIQPDLFIPDMWSFQNAEIAQGTANCLAFMGPLAGAAAAADIFGSAGWPSPGPCPGMLDIDATLVFAPGLPWVPAQDSLAAAGLPLQGC